MIIIEGKFIYLATPRTASRSVSKALLENGGRRLSNNHHAPLHIVRRAKKEYPDLPFYTFTREPTDHLASWQQMGPTTVIFETYIETAKVDNPYYKVYGENRLNCYAEFCDRIFTLEEGLPAFFDFVKVPVRLKGLHIGASKDKARITDSRKKLMAQHFPYDTDLYNRIVGVG